MEAAIQHTIDTWLNEGYDQQTKDEIVRLQKENPQELVEAFYRTLEFGTGGLRGVLGAGRKGREGSAGRCGMLGKSADEFNERRRRCGGRRYHFRCRRCGLRRRRQGRGDCHETRCS